MSLRDFFSSASFSSRTLFALALFVGCGLGILAGLQLAQPQASQLVMPRVPEQTRALKLKEQLQAPNLESDKIAFQRGPMWQLTPEGTDLFAPSGTPIGAPPPLPVQEWVMVGRVSRADGMGLVLHQKQSGISKFFKTSEILPDGRKILSVDDTGFVLGAAKGKKKERFEYAAGLMLAETPPPATSPSALSSTVASKLTVTTPVVSPTVSPANAPAKR